MSKVRIHLRHTGDSKFRFGVSRGRGRKCHRNIDFGRFFIAIRDTADDLPAYNPPFFDLSMGRTMLKNQRLREGMTEDEKNVYAEQYRHYRLDAFLKMYRAKQA